MRKLMLAVLAIFAVLVIQDAHAIPGIFGYGGGAAGIGQEFHDEDDSQWSWAEGLFGEPEPVPDGGVFSNEPGHPGWVCDVCRDPQMHPIDFTAMAYNAYFGDNPWALDSILGIPFRVYNLQLDWVVIWFEGIVFDPPSFLPDTMTVAVRLRSGEIRRFEVLQGGPDLPIGDPQPETDGGSEGYGDDGSDGSDDDDYGEADEDFEEPEYDDPDGVVEIEDPDDDGEFPEWEEEL